MPGTHALLSASSAEKWLHCPISPWMEQQVPEAESDYAAAGTLAHELAELKARWHFLEPKGPKAKAAALKKIKDHPLWDPEMDSCTDEYLDFLKNVFLNYPIQPHISLEQKVDYSTWAPEGYGTCDCVMVGTLPNGMPSEIHVIDYKHGKGVDVTPKDNPQLKLYALGAYARYSVLYGGFQHPGGIGTVRMSIVQPRSTGINTWTCSVEELLNWAALTCNPAAEIAFAAAQSGQGECNPGPYCDSHFCKARPVCCTYNEWMNTDFPPEPPNVNILDRTAFAYYLDRAKRVAAWVKTLEEYAHAELLAGREIPGYKLVDGGRKDRYFTDLKAALKILKGLGYKDAMLHKPKEPLTLAQIEKLIGKTEFATNLIHLVARKDGKPTLAPETDKREPWKPKTAEDDFSDLTQQ